MAIDLPHPWPLPLGWQSGSPGRSWVNKPFLHSHQSLVEIESSKRFGKTFLSVSPYAAGRTMEKCLSFMAGLNMIVSPPAARQR